MAAAAADREGEPDHADAAQRLLAKLVQAHGSEWLLEAVHASNLDETCALMSLGVGVNATDADGWTPLHIAVARGHVDLVRALLAMPSVQVDARGSADRTPLILACGGRFFTPCVEGPQAFDGHEMDAIVFDLLAASADPNQCDIDECSPLMYAAPQRPTIAIYLLDAGADRHHRTYSGHRVDLGSCAPEIKAARARQRWQRLARLAPLTGRMAIFYRRWYEEVTFRPCRQSLDVARDEFESLSVWQHAGSGGVGVILRAAHGHKR